MDVLGVDLEENEIAKLAGIEDERWEVMLRVLTELRRANLEMMSNSNKVSDMQKVGVAQGLRTAYLRLQGLVPVAREALKALRKNNT